MRTRLLILLLLFPLSATAQDDPPLKIGVAGPMSGAAAFFGRSIKRGAELALDELNARGGVRALKLDIQDDRGRAGTAVEVARALAADARVPIVVGHFNSTCSIAAKAVYNKVGVVSLSPGSTNVAVCKGSPWTFRNLYNDASQGSNAARYLHSVLGCKSVAIAYENDDYGKGLAASFELAAKKLGLSVIARQSYLRARTTDFGPAAKALTAKAPDAIFIAGLYNEAALLCKAIRTDPKLRKIHLLGGDGLVSPRFITTAGKTAEGVLMCTPFHIDAERASPRTKAFIASFVKRYGAEPDAWAALTYDAVLLAGEAIASCGADRKKIRDWLAAKRTKEQAFVGATGATYFDAEGDCMKPVQVIQVREGKLRLAKRQLD